MRYKYRWVAWDYIRGAPYRTASRATRNVVITTSEDVGLTASNISAYLLVSLLSSSWLSSAAGVSRRVERCGHPV